jgi:hypothetical protein
MTALHRKLCQVRVARLIPAPAEQVWARYTDPVSWNEWAGLGHVELWRRGSPHPHGSGAVRRIANAGIAVYEEVAAFEAPRRMTYRLVRGPLPIRDHEGEVLFEPCSGGTIVDWSCRFRPSLPGTGWALRLLIGAVFRRALRGLARDLAGAAAAGRRARA